MNDFEAVLVERYQKYIANENDRALKDCRIQHTSMAAGGDGGPGDRNGMTIRQQYYVGMPNRFFQRICKKMKWEWRKQ